MIETIFAPATLIGAAGLTVFRISGPKAFESLEQLTELTNVISHKAVLKTIKNPVNGKALDQGLILPFKGPNSFTGEDVVEYHLHGGQAIAQSFIQALNTLEGHRLAEPGEFTKRAFENGRIDLTQAEAVGDLIHAQTEAQRMLALDQLNGGLKDLYHYWAYRLKNALAYVEADIDFTEEDVPDALSTQMRPVIEEITNQMQKHLSDARKGERLREGVKIAVIGAPNAGKSSLLNKLAQRDIAIVTNIEGTTRDVLEVPLNLGGYPVILADTAGLRETDDVVEKEGIKRAKAWAEEADLKILLFDSSKEPDTETCFFIEEDVLICSTKTDVSKPHIKINNQEVMPLSVNDETLLSDFIKTLTQAVQDKMGNIIENDNQELTLITRQRHRIQVEEALEHLNRSLNAPQVDMMAEDVRLCVRALGKITGQVDVEDLLDVIFNDFCIGK